MRGDKEQNCLNFVKRSMFTQNGEPIYSPNNKKTYIEVDDDEFKKEQIWFINEDVYRNYFGLLKEDRDEIEQILRIAKSNEKASEFPDFLFKNGFIEHFQITSSKTTKKGAEHIKEMSNFKKKVNKEADSIKQEWNVNPDFEKIRRKQWILDNPEHNHSLLIKSFKTNWQNHIDSLQNYSGNKEIGIFLIDYSDFALGMLENVCKKWIDGMSQGDYREQESLDHYRLTRDNVLLNFIYKYKNQIKYVIFVNYFEFEIIKVENIPYLLELIPWEYQIYTLNVKNVSTLYNLSLAIDPLEDK